jgi:hypothetical protein
VEVVAAIFSAYIGIRTGLSLLRGPAIRPGPFLLCMASAATNASWWWVMSDIRHGVVRHGTAGVFGHPTAARLRFASWNAAVTVAEIRPRSDTT